MTSHSQLKDFIANLLYRYFLAFHQMLLPCYAYFGKVAFVSGEDSSPKTNFKNEFPSIHVKHLMRCCKFNEGAKNVDYWAFCSFMRPWNLGMPRLSSRHSWWLWCLRAFGTRNASSSCRIWCFKESPLPCLAFCPSWWFSYWSSEELRLFSATIRWVLLNCFKISVKFYKKYIKTFVSTTD